MTNSFPPPRPSARALLAATALTAVLVLVSAMPARAVGGCGSIKSHGARVYVAVERGRPGCRTARRVLSTYLNSHARCGGSACVRHFGWTCASSYSSFPRLASCTRRRQRIAAYSRAD
jgi:hypothetical protein